MLLALLELMLMMMKLLLMPHVPFEPWSKETRIDGCLVEVFNEGTDEQKDEERSHCRHRYCCRLLRRS